MANSIVNSNLQAYLELIVLIIIAGIVTYGPGLVGTVIPANTTLATLDGVICLFAAFLVQQFASVEGKAWFNEVMSYLKADQTGQTNKTSGAMSTILAFIIGVIIIIVIIGLVLVKVYNIDVYTALSAVVAAFMAGAVLFFKRITDGLLLLVKNRGVNTTTVTPATIITVPATAVRTNAFGVFTQTVTADINTALFFGPKGVLVDLTDAAYKKIEQIQGTPPVGNLVVYVQKVDGTVVEDLQGHYYGGKLYTAAGVKDMFADEVTQETSAQIANDIWNEMAAKAKPVDQLNFIIPYIVANGGPSVIDLELELCETPKLIADMKAAGKLQNFIDNMLPIVWAAQLAEPDVEVLADAKRLWQKYVAKIPVTC